MSNISITTLCNRSCSYCFARSLSSGPRHIPFDMFEKALDYLRRSDIRRVRLLGGEPTLHPDFALLLDAIEARNLELLLFSNGRIPEKAMEKLRNFPRKQLSILLNVHAPASQSNSEKKQFQRMCRHFGSIIMLGCNIYSPKVEPDFMLPLINRFSLVPEIRLGLAHPCINAENQFLHPRHYRSVGSRIGAFARKAKKSGVRLELDCGFVPCMFDQDDLQLLSEFGEIPGKRCNPLPDLLPDGHFIPCYPLADVTYLDFQEDSYNESVQTALSKSLARYRQAGIFSECGVCRLRREHICNGGCLAAAMKRLRHIPFSVRLYGQAGQKVKQAASQSIEIAQAESVISDDIWHPVANSWAIPYIDQPLSFWQEIKQRFPTNILEVYFPLPDPDFPSGRPLQKTAFLSDFLSNSPVPLALLINPVILPEPVCRVAPVVIEQLRRLRDTVNVDNVTVADYTLALRIKETFPDIALTASVLMDIARPNQAMLLNGVCDTLVPASRIMRDTNGLKAIRQAFNGAIRLMVNEACLPDCVFRTQHFYEMAFSDEKPRSLCREVLDRNSWLRLSGTWVLPQHLHLFDDIVDEFKLAGRVTLQNPEKYLRVLQAYITRSSLLPNGIGGGPASVLTPVAISEEFYRHTLICGKQCHSCSLCSEYHTSAASEKAQPTRPDNADFPITQEN